MSCQRSDHDALHSIGLNFHDRLSSTDFYSCSSPSLSPNRWGDDIEERDDCQAPIWHSRSYAATLAVCTRHRSGSAAVEIKSAPRHGSAQSKEMNFDTVLRKAISESSIDDFSILRSDPSLCNHKADDLPRRRSINDVEHHRRSSSNFANKHYYCDVFVRDNVRFQADAMDGERARPTARRAAVVASLPESDFSCLSDTIANLQRNRPVSSTADFKRPKWSFRNLMIRDKERTKELKLEEVLLKLSPKREQDVSLWATLSTLETYKEQHYQCQLSDDETAAGLTVTEKKRRDATWELFASERTYLVDHLLVLRQIFMEPLQQLQCDGYLLSVDVRSLFGNLEELCQVSLEFCRNLLSVVGNSWSKEWDCADAIVSAFEKFEANLCPPYQRYCTSYGNSLMYREDLKTDEDFATYIKWCEKNPRCQRLKLGDFLVAPIQHVTKYPLLLRQILKNTADPTMNDLIEKTLRDVEKSLHNLNGKVTWLTNFQFLQDLQDSISWPPVYEIDTKTPLPEEIRRALSQQPCRKLIASPKRRLVYDGMLSVIEQHVRPVETYAMLFDDMLIFTRPAKKAKRKASEVPSTLKRHSVLKDGTLLVVYRQPVAFDRFMLYDVGPEQASSLGVKNSFVIVQENRFQQMILTTMLQASSEESKSDWLKRLASTAAQWMEKHIYLNTADTSQPDLSRQLPTVPHDEFGESDNTSKMNNFRNRSRLQCQGNIRISISPNDEDVRSSNGGINYVLPNGGDMS